MEAEAAEVVEQGERHVFCPSMKPIECKNIRSKEHMYVYREEVCIVLSPILEDVQERRTRFLLHSVISSFRF